MDFVYGRIVASVVAAALVGGLALVTRAGIRRLNVNLAQRLRARTMARFGLGLLLVTVLVIVWADAIRAAALVFSAFAVAIVIGFKEIILCGLGWYLKIVSGSYRIGDRVQVGEIRGDVVDYGIVTTTVLEVLEGPGGEILTGRMLTFPNSVLLIQPVRNASQDLGFIWKEISWVADRDDDWRAAEQMLLASAAPELASYRDRLEGRLHELEESEDFLALDPQSVEPRVLVAALDDGRIRLSLRLPVPTLEAGEVQDRIWRAFLERWRGAKPQSEGGGSR